MPLLVIFGIAGREIAIDLSIELSGLAITVLVLMFAIEWREYKQWIPVREKVMETIGKRLQTLFVEFVILCKCTYVKRMPQESLDEFERRQFFLQLGELNKRVELNETGIRHFSEGEYADVYERRAKRIGDIEDKYSRFLEASLRLSLMEIQDNLIGIDQDFRIRKDSYLFEKLFKSEEQFLKSISTKINNVIKETYKLHKMGINIYQGTPWVVVEL